MAKHRFGRTTLRAEAQWAARRAQLNAAAAPCRFEGREGSFLVIAVFVLSVVLAITLGSLAVVRNQGLEVRLSQNRLVAQRAAQSAVEGQLAELRRVRGLASPAAPFAGIEALDPNSLSGPGGFTQVVDKALLQSLSGSALAEYDVVIDVQATGANERTVHVAGYAYVPSEQAYRSGDPEAVRADAHAVTRLRFDASQVFDYAYFVNHWGFFFDGSITVNGSARANGPFDATGEDPSVNGSPRYKGSEGDQLVGYVDDNGDAVLDGSDGGLYSAHSVQNAQNVQGMGGNLANQHLMGTQLQMPNLSDLSPYEDKARSLASSLSVGGTTYVSAVLGDDAGERQHLFLTGTEDEPIVIDGPVVVRGSVVISGYVTGQGSIYAGGNVFVADDLLYRDGPATPRPGANVEESIEGWRQAAQDRDLLGLFARGHIVLGDYTHHWWQNYVGDWMSDPLNPSAEDAGADGIPNTREGPDGVLGTSDDDVLEGDGIWTVSYYTEEDAARGLIPAGKEVGDVVPGSGEDIDGDGVYDCATAMSEFELPAALDPADWTGNFSEPVEDYADVSTIYIDRIDAVLYTNHALAGVLVNWGGDIQLNGAAVSRNESIIYGADRLLFQHDERLTGRGGEVFGLVPPQAWDPIEVVEWEFDKALPSSVLDEPDDVVAYFVASGGA
jgi:hypothetical protein